MSGLDDFPGYLGFTSKGVIAIHANWPAYPEEHEWELPLLWLSIFSLRTKFIAIDDIDRCVLFVAVLKCNKPDHFDEKNFHLAVWHEDLLELQAKKYIRGVHATNQRQYERKAQKKAFADLEKRFGTTKLCYQGPDGKMIEYNPPPLGDYDPHWGGWPVFRDGSISLTSKGKHAAAELLLKTSRAELKPLGRRVLTAMEAGLYDTAVREACVTLETDIKRELKVALYGDNLVDAYAKHLKQTGLLIESHLKTFRIELRAVFKFLRNDFMHNLRRIDEAGCVAILLRVVKVRNMFRSINAALKKHTGNNATASKNSPAS